MPTAFQVVESRNATTDLPAEVPQIWGVQYWQRLGGDPRARVQLADEFACFDLALRCQSEHTIFRLQDAAFLNEGGEGGQYLAGPSQPDPNDRKVLRAPFANSAIHEILGEVGKETEFFDGKAVGVHEGWAPLSG